MVEVKNINKSEIIEVQKNTIDDGVIYKEVKEPYGFIYITTNLKNGKRYLGQKSFVQGWQNYLGSGNLFKKALEKYGKESFKRDIVLVCYSSDELNQVEYELSLFFDVVNSDDWYNLVLGGGTSRGWNPSEETKRKIGEKAKERLSDPTNHPRYGKSGLSGESNPQFGVSPKERMDEETYNQWYEKHKQYWKNPSTKGKHIWKDKPHPNLGKKFSKETRESLSIAAKKRYQQSNSHPMAGKKHKKESKDKIKKGRCISNINKGITVYSPTLDVLFYGASDAAQKIGMKDSSGITSCCKGKQQYCGVDTASGEKITWMYAPDAIEKSYVSQERYDLFISKLL